MKLAKVTSVGAPMTVFEVSVAVTSSLPAIGSLRSLTVRVSDEDAVLPAASLTVNLTTADSESAVSKLSLPEKV